MKLLVAVIGMFFAGLILSAKEDALLIYNFDDGRDYSRLLRVVRGIEDWKVVDSPTPLMEGKVLAVKLTVSKEQNQGNLIFDFVPTRFNKVRMKFWSPTENQGAQVACYTSAFSAYRLANLSTNISFLTEQYRNPEGKIWLTHGGATLTHLSWNYPAQVERVNLNGQWEEMNAENEKRWQEIAMPSLALVFQFPNKQFAETSSEAKTFWIYLDDFQLYF